VESSPTRTICASWPVCRSSGSAEIAASSRYASSRRPPAIITASSKVIESVKTNTPGRWTAPYSAIRRLGRKPVFEYTMISSNS